MYAYASEDIAWWSQDLQRDDLGPGIFGENLTTDGVDVTNAVIGECWRIGSVELEVCQPRLPCFKARPPLRRSADAQADRQRQPAGRYLRILTRASSKPAIELT